MQDAVELRDRLLRRLRHGDTIALVRVGGSVQHKQFEIVMARERGRPQFITSLVCGLLGYRRGGRDRSGGLRCPGGWTAQDLCEALREELRIDLDFTTY